MKAIAKSLNVVALFFATLMFLQSCVVYKSANVTVEEASKSNTKIRIKTYDNQTLKYDNIEVVNNEIIGVKVNKNSRRITVIEKDNIEKIQLKDKTTSTILTVGILVTAIVVMFGLIFQSSLNDMDLGSRNTSN